MYSGWWGRRFGHQEDTFSILELVNLGTIDCKLAALLWLMMERRASVLVAAGPSFVGKTTLLNALLDFLPVDVHQILLKGYYEDYKFLEESAPRESYLVAEEISNHGYFEYLWGREALKVFGLLSRGYGLGATIHSRSSEEAVYVLNRVLGIPLAQVSNLSLVVNLRVAPGRTWDDEPLRRIGSVDLLLPHPEGLSIQGLAAPQAENGFDYLAGGALRQSLAKKGLLAKGNVEAEIETRKRFLKHLLDKGTSSRRDVRDAVRGYYVTKAR